MGRGIIMSDLISRQVLELWNRYKPTIAVDAIEYDRELNELLGTNLAEVGTNCSEFPNNSDAISRQAAIDALRAMQTYKLFAGDDMLLIDQAGAQTELMLLPPIQPKRGMWIEDKGQQTLMQNFIERGEVWRVCSVCGAGHMIGHKYAIDKAYHDRHHNFCPNCGAKMEVTT